MTVSALLIAAWVYAPIVASNTPPVYFATKDACEAYAVVRDAPRHFRCFPTGAGQ